MNLVVIIITSILALSLSYKSTLYDLEKPIVQQDSTPPKSGIVKVKELTVPNKKDSKKTEPITKEEPRKNQSEKIADVTQTKAWQKAQKEKEREAKKDVNKETEEVAQNKEGLTLEEEIKLLSKKENIETENKIHPDNQKQCDFAFDVTDEFTGVRKRGLPPRAFFNYTPEEYRKFIQKGDFISCEGFLSQNSAGEMALNINLSVASSEAKQKFGAIKANSSLILRAMDGKEYYLMTFAGAEPQIADNTTNYQCSFSISKSDLKQLKKSEVDQVKLTFQKGFQVYDVFYLDFLIDQFPCFE